MTAQGQNSSERGTQTDGPPLESPFMNQLPEQLSSDLALGRRLGVAPVSPTGPDFLRYANTERIKWVITQEGELKIIPHTWSSREIPHVVASGGQPVLAAGEAELVVHGTTRFGIRITAHSGHYLKGASPTVNARVLELGRQAFARAGISFPP